VGVCILYDMILQNHYHWNVWVVGIVIIHLVCAPTNVVVTELDITPPTGHVELQLGDQMFVSRVNTGASLQFLAHLQLQGANVQDRSMLDAIDTFVIRDHVLNNVGDVIPIDLM